jgi:nucleotide-binding universal stress UspA family protein
MLKLETILCPTDFSKPSEYAFELAAALARDHGARLVVLHALPPTIVYGELVPMPPTPPDEYLPKFWEAFHRLEAADPRARELRIETRVVEGTPADTIREIAEEIGASLIVMGTHGRTGLSRLLMGSVAEEVLRKAACPVMTVKRPVATVAAVAVPVAAAGSER